MPFERYLSNAPVYEIIFRPFASMIKHGSMPSSLSLWFLLLLFEVQVLFKFIQKDKTLCIALFAVLCIGAILSRMGGDIASMCFNYIFRSVLFY